MLDVLGFLYTPPLERIALDACDRLEARAPPSEVTARGVCGRELVRDLREGRADAGIVRFPEDDEGFELRRLRGDPVCALVAEAHPLAAHEAISLSDLGGFPLLAWAVGLGQDDYNAFVLGVLAEAAITPTIFTARRLDVPNVGAGARGRAVALIGASERSPGGTVKVAIPDAPRMPVNVAFCASVAQKQVDLVTDAVQASVDALSAQYSKAQQHAR